MSHPLIDRLTHELGWPLLDTAEAVDAFLARPGIHCLFAPGNPATNLETTDAAVILPELRMTFQKAFDCAVLAEAIEVETREKRGVLKSPAFLFFDGSEMTGAIAKVRDWDEYIHRISHILGRAAA